MEKKQLFGLIGSIILFLGLFAPATRGWFGMTANFIQFSPLFGSLMLLIAIAAIVFTILKKYIFLAFAGAGTIAIMGLLFVLLVFRRMSATGLDAMFNNTVQISWGWLLVLIGAGLLIASAIVTETRQRLTS